MLADFLYPVVVASYLLSYVKSSSFTWLPLLRSMCESIKRMDITIVTSHLAKILSSLHIVLRDTVSGEVMIHENVMWVWLEEIELPLTLLTEQEKLLRNRKASDCMVFIYKYFFPQWKDFTYCWILLLWARTEGCV